jgi:alkanesulfonate monooxygenase SsuD/methylene tetrahydromethanopterin reductase-like flavin-dependent oxidoreductase (luciferase family)
MEATMAVPDELVDEVCLIGTKDRIRDRLDAWRDAGVSTLVVGATDVATLRTIAEVNG